MKKVDELKHLIEQLNRVQLIKLEKILTTKVNIIEKTPHCGVCNVGDEVLSYEPKIIGGILLDIIDIDEEDGESGC